MCIVICTLLLSRPARGAWVEICAVPAAATCIASRAPQGARGLKYVGKSLRQMLVVAPRKGRVG